VTVDARDAEAEAQRSPPLTVGLRRWWRGVIARWTGADDRSASRSYRYLARQIAADFPYREGGRTILISSPGPLELISNTLLMFACYTREELGCRLLLVDGTFREDGVGAVLGHADAPGFRELLYGTEYRLADLICATERPGISLLPAGRPPRQALLSTEIARASSIFSEARRSFDYVLLQEASILTDSRYLSFTGFADLLLLVVEEGATSLGELDRCEKLLRDHQIANARLILAASDYR
jgi:Mrp family chromosome partitioning ATPase